MTDLLSNVKLPGGWADQARCNDHPRVSWFPDHHDTAAIRAAKRICEACPVRQQCLEHALRVGERWGIWGGLTTDERHRDRTQLLTPIAHGTDRGYAAHRRRGDQPCKECRTAHAEAGRLYKLREVG